MNTPQTKNKWMKTVKSELETLSSKGVSCKEMDTLKGAFMRNHLLSQQKYSSSELSWRTLGWTYSLISYGEMVQGHRVTIRFEVSRGGTSFETDELSVDVRKSSKLSHESSVTFAGIPTEPVASVASGSNAPNLALILNKSEGNTLLSSARSAIDNVFTRFDSLPDVNKPENIHEMKQACHDRMNEELAAKFDDAMFADGSFWLDAGDIEDMWSNDRATDQITLEFSYTVTHPAKEPVCMSFRQVWKAQGD